MSDADIASPDSSIAPATRATPVTPDPGLPRFSKRAAVAGVLALLPFLLVASAFMVHRPYVPLMCLLALVVAVAAFIFSIVATVGLGRAPAELRGRWLAGLAIPASVVAMAFGFMSTLLAAVSFSRGRQLRERGRPIFANLVRDTQWLDHVPAVDAPPVAAHAWRENGKTEHASVEAFTRLAEELRALGAPEHLVDDALRDRADEARHTRLCFSLARAIDGQDLEPGAIPAPPPSSLLAPLASSRTARLARLAVDSLVDGALNEGTSARVVAKLARCVDDAAIRRVLVGIASDEGRHASHGWDVLAWCISAGGAPVCAAIRGALWALPSTIGATGHDGGPGAGDDGMLEPFGIPSRRLLDDTYAEVRATVVARARALVDAEHATLWG